MVSGTVTISSSYGAEGALIGRELAQRLNTEFFDRAIPVAVARELAVETDQAIERDWHAPGRMERFLSAMASTWLPYLGPNPQSEFYFNADVFRQATESILRQIADGTGGVILGRASAIVLKGRSNVLRVRLDGPVEARILLAAQTRGLDEATARHEQQATDEARARYLQVFYNASYHDDQLYHLVLDRTALSRGACVEMILCAAENLLHPGPASIS
jgi:hypothetical protein